MKDVAGARPWPAPHTPWVMAQSWRDLLFAHWPVAPEVLRPLVPGSLPLDTRDGQAWIGVVPFRMTGVRPRLFPALPWLSAFPELNVRTYVTRDDKPGVFFFSLDATNPLAVAAARRLYHLPYFRARMALTHHGDAISYTSRRTHAGAPKAEFRGRYSPTGPVARAASGSLDHWLTERYCLYAVDAAERAWRGEIQHEAWPLQPAQASFDVNSMTQPLGIELLGAPLLRFARRLDVVLWPPQALR
jgi:hypothetical protein